MAKWKLDNLSVCVVVDYEHEVWNVFLNEKAARKAVKKLIKEEWPYMPKQEVKEEMGEWSFKNRAITL